MRAYGAAELLDAHTEAMQDAPGAAAARLRRAGGLEVGDDFGHQVAGFGGVEADVDTGSA